jgi:hypothetical protein
MSSAAPGVVRPQAPIAFSRPSRSSLQKSDVRPQVNSKCQILGVEMVSYAQTFLLTSAERTGPIFQPDAVGAPVDFVAFRRGPCCL